MSTGRSANASAERQAAFVAGREAEQARRREEVERCIELRSAGVADNEQYRPRDWSDEHGAWLVPVPELLTVRTPDVLTGRQPRKSNEVCAAERAAAEQAAATSLTAALAELADDVLDEERAERLDERIAGATNARGGEACCGDRSDGCNDD